MALVIIMILLVFGLGIVGNLFSTLNPFVEKLGNVTNYNTAYYAATMSAERWLLALRYHDAGFEWQSGIKSGNNSDSIPSTTYFWKLTAPTSDSYWKISSMVQRIPWSGNGNVETLYAGEDSKDYNVLWYNETIYIPLYKDTTSNTGEYYTGGNTQSLFENSTSPKFVWTFRLPAGVRQTFNSIDETTDEALLDDGNWDNTNDNGTEDIDEDDIDDDIILQRWMQWFNDGEKFTIQPTINNNLPSWKPEYMYDNAIRETAINEATTTSIIESSEYDFSFLNTSENNGSEITQHNILPLYSDLTWQSFLNILKNGDSDLTWLTLSFSITNLMKTKENHTYPFLEWYFSAEDNSSPINIPDRFYTLDAVWTINNYTVRFQIKKPVKENSNVSNFTIIF